MPMNRSLYPPDWAAIARGVKAAAGWRCEECGRECRRTGESLGEFIGRNWGGSSSPRFLAQVRASVFAHPQRWTLTVHHPHADTENPDADLVALCAPCHLKADGGRHAESRREKRRILRREVYGQTEMEEAL